MYVRFLRVRKQAFAICHDNLWMFLMAQIPNLYFCPRHGWALQAVTPPLSISSQNALWGLWRMSWPSVGHISNWLLWLPLFFFVIFSLLHLLKSRRDRIDYIWVFSEQICFLVQVHLGRKAIQHYWWYYSPLTVWPNTDSTELASCGVFW